MAQPQENQDSKEIADWVDIGYKMDDDSDQPKPKNELHDQVKSAKTSENENKSEPKVMTRYIDVLEEMVKFFTDKDIVMDLQLASGAMIQVTKRLDEDAKADYRTVRLIGNLENIDKAEKLIYKAVIASVDAGGYGFLFKDDSDTDGYSDESDKPLSRSRSYRSVTRPYGQRRYSSEYDSDDRADLPLRQMRRPPQAPRTVVMSIIVMTAIVIVIALNMIVMSQSYTTETYSFS